MTEADGSFSLREIFLSFSPTSVSADTRGSNTNNAVIRSVFSVDYIIRSVVQSVRLGGDGSNTDNGVFHDSIRAEPYGLKIPRRRPS